MRKNILAGNWKMNLSKEEAINLYSSIHETFTQTSTEVIVFPPAIYIDALKALNKNIKIGAQNFYFEEKGAFTGEISVTQMKGIGAEYVLIGHSERRMYFNETNQILKSKVDSAIKHDLNIIFCCGEPLEIRESGTEVNFVTKQIEESLFHLSQEDFSKIVIAYEPIWAIGTGKTASSEQAEEMHAALRGFIAKKYGNELAENISILYGGSCNPSNSKEIFSKTNVDGGLIGGAALKSEDFLALHKAF